MGIKTNGLGFQTTQCFLYGFLEVTADGHHFTHGLHLGGQHRIRFSKLLEVEARDLGNHVIDGRLEGSRGLATGDLILQLIQGVTHRQLGGHLGDREAGGLGSQRRGTAHPRVHLDHHHATVVRVDAELHVGTTGFHANFTQHRQRGVAHDLQLFIGERLRRRHGDGVTGMHAHGVKVLDGTDDDAVVLFVTDHFHLVFFPAQQGLVDQQLVGGRQVQTTLADFLEFFPVIRNTTAGATHGETGADNAGKTQVFQGRAGFFHVMGDSRTRTFQADGLHGLVEAGAIFRLVDGIFGGANHFHAELFQHPIVVQVQGTVQCGLATHGGQQRVRALLLDDLGHGLPGNRLDVGRIRHGRVGHDGGRVGVHQNDPEPLFPQRLTRLRTGVVKLTGLADHNRASANNEDAF